MAENNTKVCRSCGTMQVHRRLLDSDPDYARRLARIEEQAFRARRGMMPLRPGCTRIPVVVHVVWKTPAQNISQAQIDSQIAVLNQDFRATNGDISTVPAPFAPLTGDARLVFALADRDPAGNPHDGVVRVQTDRDGFGSDDAVKFSSSGGSDAWPRDEYLNIWVCQLTGGLLGYAQFPGGAAATDGVVVTHTGFGTTGTASPPFNRGRTTTHEIGHWLNLRHIWGDDGGGCSGSDFVDDTPNQGGPNTGEPSFPTISCSNGPNGDMFMNFMDYVDDAAMVMFSEGQVVRMHACLDGPRSAIGETVPCGGKPPFKDAAKDPLSDPVPKSLANDPPKSIIQDGPKNPVQDPPKPPIYDPPKGIFEPPKQVIDPPKGIADPPKGLTDPPKSALEPPFGPPLGPPVVTPPIQPPMQPATPFVLGTGAPAASAQQPAPLLAHYAQILQSYASLHQRGLLDAQGLAAWQQAYAAYQQLGGR
ncbi:zinc metalloprotease [Paracoccus siganidrum]|nr:zinc metalloprotease [Paracoccus siganidrum]